MMPKLSPSEKYELVKLIVDAGLEEDFMEWLRNQGYTHLFGRLDNIPDELIESYIRIKKLLPAEDYDSYLEALRNMDELEPPGKRTYIPARKE